MSHSRFLLQAQASAAATATSASGGASPAPAPAPAPAGASAISQALASGVGSYCTAPMTCWFKLVWKGTVANFFMPNKPHNDFQSLCSRCNDFLLFCEKVLPRVLAGYTKALSQGPV